MKIHKFTKEKKQVFFEIEEESQILSNALEEVYKEELPQIRIPGFRQGKVPRAIFKKFVGDKSILDKASQRVISDSFFKAVKEKQIEALSFPTSIEVKQLENGKPLIFTMIIPIKPEIKLGHYKKITVKQKKIIIDSSELETELQKLLDSQAQYLHAPDKNIGKEDLVRFDIESFNEGKSYLPLTKKGAGCRVGFSGLPNAFDENLLGLKENEEKNFELKFPADYSDKEIQDKSISVKVKIKEIRQKEVPVPDDSFVSKFGLNSVEELKEKIAQQLKSFREKKEEERVRDEVINEVIKEVGFDLSEILVDRKIDFFVRQFEGKLQKSKFTLADYFRLNKKDLNILRNEFRPQAQEAVKSDLVLDAVAKAEKIEVLDSDLEMEIEQLVKESKQTKEEFKNSIGEAGLDYIKTYLRRRKVVDFLYKNAHIEWK